MDLALIGLVLPNVENHSLAALERAATRAGLSAAIVPFGGWHQLQATVSAVERLAPRWCGISIQTSESALAALAVAWLLRRRGFAGRLVCGGHFATLNAEEILSAPAGVDAVVRFAGEEALVGLLRSGGDEQWAALPGVVFKAEDGAIRLGAPASPASAAQPLGDLGRDRDRALPLHLGFSAADLIFSRGCAARCSYCCIAGSSQLLREEARRGGGSLDESLYHRHPVAAIAEELAALHHERGARVFNFMDDNVLPLDAREAAEWTRELARELAARKVGRIAFSMQLRADAASPEVVDGLIALGLVRAYVGIDGYTTGQLRALGRAAPAQAGTDALARLHARGVFAVCNALVIGPTFTFETVCAEIEGLARLEHAPVHLLPVEVRAGTAYFATAERRGLLEGGFLFRHYRFEDPRTALLGELITSLPTRLAERSVPIALYDLGYNLGIARRLCPEADVRAPCETYARVTARWNADQVRVLRAGAAAARAGRTAIAALIEVERPRVRAHDEALLEECDAALSAVERAVSRAQRRDVRSHARGRLLSSVSLALGLAACNSSGGAGADGAANDLASSDLSYGSDLAVPYDLNGVTCPGGRTIETEVQACVECGAPADLQITFDSQGLPVAFRTGDGGALSSMVTDCLNNFFASYCYPTLAGQTVPVSAHCWIA